MENIILSSNYKFEDLAKEKRVIFFDVDSTLGGNSTRHGLYSFASIREKKRKEFEIWKEQIGLSFFSFADYIAIDESCLAMFLTTLLETNAVPFSISSWVTSCSVRASKTDREDLNGIDLMHEVFQNAFEEWNQTKIIGGRSLNPLDRGDFCEELSKKYGFDYMIIDDSWDVYENKKNLIKVNGDCGYQYKNHREIIEHWKDS